MRFFSGVRNGNGPHSHFHDPKSTPRSHSPQLLPPLQPQLQLLSGAEQLQSNSSLSYSMPSAVVASYQDEEQCPVCLEPLSLRLEGEKPHIVPQCGHRLHEVCFESVYGGVSRARMKPGTPLGLCGICRRDMKLSGETHNAGRKNKFAEISGARPAPGSGSDNYKMRSVSHRTLGHDNEALHDPTEDDEIVNLPLPHGTSSSGSGSASTIAGYRRDSGDTARGGGSSSGGLEIVRPTITVRAEHPSVARHPDRYKKQHLTCMVTIEMPSKWQTPAPPVLNRHEREDSSNGTNSTRQPPKGDGPPSNSYPSDHHLSTSSDPNEPSPTHHLRATSPRPDSIQSTYAYGSTPPATSALDGVGNNPFSAVVEDLQARMVDWKGHSPDEFGTLKLFDYIHVRKEKNVREFLVYLFEEAILCVTDDKRKGLTGKIVDGIYGGAAHEKLRLKGRVYVRHIRRVLDTSEDGELSLTIMMSDDALDEFVMTFKEKSSLDNWKSQIESLVQSRNMPPPAPSSGMGRHRAPTDSMSAESYHAGSDYSQGSDSYARSSAYSGYTRTTATSAAAFSPVIREEENSGDESAPLKPTTRSRSSTHLSASQPSPYSVPPPLPPLNVNRDFTPLDLILILSVPTSGPTSLKLGIIKSSLDFIIQNVGPRTRLSIVTFSAGEGARGLLRKTPFIALGKEGGRSRLEAVVNDLGNDSGNDLAMIDHLEERVNVVTAVNLALDIILQRKIKSALSGMILMNDGKDGAQKTQMDLVMTRAEAANIPIHAIGWGRSHDPSALWLLSNHSGGTYTFVKEFYDLRDALVGVIGSILSIACTNVKLHISVPERRWFRIRKIAGTPGAVISSEGNDVDIDVGELRWGERKDLLVEVEMSLAGYGYGDSFGQSDHEERNLGPTFSTATDAFFLSKVGLNPSALDEFQSANFYDSEYDGMPDEVALFEVNASYRDPAAGKNISRLGPSPCLLTVTLTPPTPPGTRTPPQSSAPEIVRRRMELLCSDMLTRTLLLMSRRNEAQAKRLLSETLRIITTIKATLTPTSPPSRIESSSSHRASYVAAQSAAYAMLVACAEDVSTVLEGCADRQFFDSSIRNFAAQQAVILRDQRSFSGRTKTERLFWTSDNSLFLVARSQQWTSTRSD